MDEPAYWFGFGVASLCEAWQEHYANLRDAIATAANAIGARTIVLVGPGTSPSRTDLDLARLATIEEFILVDRFPGVLAMAKEDLQPQTAVSVSCRAWDLTMGFADRVASALDSPHAEAALAAVVDQVAGRAGPSLRNAVEVSRPPCLYVYSMCIASAFVYAYETFLSRRGASSVVELDYRRCNAILLSQVLSDVEEFVAGSSRVLLVGDIAWLRASDMVPQFEPPFEDVISGTDGLCVESQRRWVWHDSDDHQHDVRAVLMRARTAMS